MKSIIHICLERYIFLALTIITISGCKKFIEVDAPITSVNNLNVYEDKSYAISVLTGIYTQMASTQFSLNFSVYPELSADNLELFDANNAFAKQYYQNLLTENYTGATSIFWNDLYNYIFFANSAIEGLSKSENLPSPIKQRLLGEAYFLRGFYFFYLTNMYGNIPLVVTTDYTVNTSLGNGTPQTIYDQIVKDLKQSQELLNDDYVGADVVTPTTERLRPNRMAATAMLAKVYLYNNKYDLAEKAASTVIQSTDLYLLSALDNVFAKNSSEIIWALQPVVNNKNTMEGDFYIYSTDGPNSINYTYLSENLLESFEPGDDRKSKWVGVFDAGSHIYSYPFKYKVKIGDPSSPLEYTIVLRLAEQFLIRAESRIMQGNISGGVNDLNLIRTRSRASSSPEVPDPLPDFPTNLTKEQAISALLNERRIELFAEWGSRWFDLKRMGRLDGVMSRASLHKGGQWASYKALYPIPLTEIRGNPNVKQNSGY